MTQYIEVVPAYGRDYNSKKALMADWNAGLDFQIVDFGSRWDGAYINKPQQTPDMVIMARYKKLTQVCRIDYSAKPVQPPAPQQDADVPVLRREQP